MTDTAPAVAVYNPGGAPVVVDAAGHLVFAGEFACAERAAVRPHLEAGRLAEVTDPRAKDPDAELAPSALAALDAVAKANEPRKAPAAKKAAAQAAADPQE